MASRKAKAKRRLLRADEEIVDEEPIHRNRSMKLKQTLFLILFEKRKKRHSSKGNRAPTKLTLSIMPTFFNDNSH